MPLTSERLFADTREEFCAALKAARERKGITLQAIAETTKVPAYLFAALERNDLRRWPRGLFRRSFFRDYARAIGLPVPGTCEEFERLFPDDEGRAVAKATDAADVASRVDDLRLVFDEAWHGPRGSALLRLLAAGIDTALVVAVSLALTSMAGIEALPITAIVALAYFGFGTVLLGASPAKYALSGWRPVLDALTLALGGKDAGSTEPTAEPPAREWITDARRVGPPPRLRVRIKVSQ